ncbi:MAG: LCP family protein [Candidatus Woesebacteria bacterium]
MSNRFKLKNIQEKAVKEKSSSAAKKKSKNKLDQSKKAKLLSGKQILLRATLLSFVFLLCFFLITILVIAFSLYRKVDQFTQAAEISIPELKQTLMSGWNKTVVAEQGHKNILILGVDSLENRGDVPALTDTIILASLNLNSGQTKLLLLPRDLWSEEYKTKINALLAYGHDRFPEKPERFPKVTIENLLNIPIHHIVIVSLNDLAQLIDLLGGVEVEIQTAFIDEQFPRSNVNIQTETDPAKLYETVEFKQGKELMTGERTLKYIRSRHSQGEEGSDISRGLRQQKVITALFKKISNFEYLAANPELSGKLYRFYLDKFNQSLNIEELIATAKILYPHYQEITISGENLSIYPEEELGVITNPPLWKYQGQWVYEIRDLEKFRTESKNKLGFD